MEKTKLDRHTVVEYFIEYGIDMTIAKFNISKTVLFSILY